MGFPSSLFGLPLAASGNRPPRWTPLPLGIHAFVWCPLHGARVYLCAQQNTVEQWFATSEVGPRKLLLFQLPLSDHSPWEKPRGWALSSLMERSV